MLVRSAPPITGSLPRRAGFNQMEKKDLSLIICSVSSFNLTKRAPHVSCSLTSPYAAADYCLWNTGVKSSDHNIYLLLFLSDGKTVTAEVPQGRSETLHFLFPNCPVIVLIKYFEAGFFVAVLLNDP